MRRLQGALLDGHDINFLKKTAKAADAVKDAIGTKVSSGTGHQPAAGQQRLHSTLLPACCLPASISSNATAGL